MIFRRKKTTTTLVMQAGMGRSGSTLAYRLLKEMIDFTGPHIEVEKHHDFIWDRLRRADVIVTTYRDIRDVVASELRQEYRRQETINDRRAEFEDIGFLVKRHARFYWDWHYVSDYEFVYEDYISSPYGVIDDLRHVLMRHKIPLVRGFAPGTDTFEEIKENAEHDSTKEHEDGLHRTNHGAIGSYREILTNEQAQYVLDLWDKIKAERGELI